MSYFAEREPLLGEKGRKRVSKFLRLNTIPTALHRLSFASIRKKASKSNPVPSLISVNPSEVTPVDTIEAQAASGIERALEDRVSESNDSTQLQEMHTPNDTYNADRYRQSIAQSLAWSRYSGGDEIFTAEAVEFTKYELAPAPSNNEGSAVRAARLCSFHRRYPAKASGTIACGDCEVEEARYMSTQLRRPLPRSPSLLELVTASPTSSALQVQAPRPLPRSTLLLQLPPHLPFVGAGVSGPHPDPLRLHPIGGEAGPR